jgi:hypothetical protein
LETSRLPIVYRSSAALQNFLAFRDAATTDIKFNGVSSSTGLPTMNIAMADMLAMDEFLFFYCILV